MKLRKKVEKLKNKFLTLQKVSIFAPRLKKQPLKTLK